MAKKDRIPNISIENATILFRNFAGNPDKYHKNGGYRKFNVIIEDPEEAQRLSDDGWNVRILAPRDEGDEPRHTLEVAVTFNQYPPKIVMITRRAKVELDEESVASLDYADIISADLVITPYTWEVDGKSGIKAYLKTMYVTIEEDEFADKYAD